MKTRKNKSIEKHEQIKNQSQTVLQHIEMNNFLVDNRLYYIHHLVHSKQHINAKRKKK